MKILKHQENQILVFSLPTIVSYEIKMIFILNFNIISGEQQSNSSIKKERNAETKDRETGDVAHTASLTTLEHI